MIANPTKKEDVTIEEDLSSAVGEFGAAPSDVTEGEMLAESVHAAVEAANEIAEEMLPELKEDLAAAKEIMDAADGTQEAEKADEVRAKLEELDTKPE